jgi:gliding motility-associated-like protein
MKLFFRIFYLLISFQLTYSQSPTCATASAMCSGQGGPYNNTNTTTPGGNQTGIGPITGCGTSNTHGNNGSLGSTPRPAWFYYTVGQSGPIVLNLQQNNTNGNPIDVDFALWGPFNTTNLANICNSLSGVVGSAYTGPCNLVDASFSPSANENIHIPNGITGEVYLLLVTNFNGAAGTYTINQTNAADPGAGQISCDRVCGIDLGPDRRFCTTNVSSLELQATFIQAPTTGGIPSYSWYFYNGTTWELRATTPTNRYTVNENGFWRVKVTRPGCTDVTQDDIEVRFATRPAVNDPNNLNAPVGVCSHTFDLTQNQVALTAPAPPSNYVIKYYLNENDCLDGNANFIANPASYTVTTTTTIYVRVENLGYSTCADSSKFFDLVIQCIPASCQLDLTSAGTTINQTICLNSAIQNITYSFGGEATGAFVTGLPSSLVATVASGVVTISGTPTQTGVISYTVTSVGCTTNIIRQGTITINAVPALTSLTSNTPICNGSDAVFTIQGTSGAVVNYTINGGTALNVTIPSSGQATITVTAPTSNVNLALSSINLGTCSVTLTNTSQVVVNALPNVTSITSNSPICSGTSAIFTVNGTANATVTYTINGGTPITTTINASGVATITVPNATTNVSVALTQVNIGLCSKPLTLSGNVTTLVAPSISSLTSNSPICNGSTAIFTINGTANTTVTYAINGGSATNIVLNSLGTSTISIANASANQTIQLSNIFDGICNRTLTNAVTVVVNPIPNTPTLSPQSDAFCIGENIIFNVVGGANEVIVYTVNNGVNQTLSLNSSGTGTISISNPTTEIVEINLINITNGLCSKLLTVFNDAEIIRCDIPKGVSPNGDGLNDTWDLSGYNVKKVEIFNRYGAKVYSKSSYTNEWRGQSDKNSELPDGTYYYVVEFNDSVVKTGWVYINREQK